MSGGSKFINRHTGSSNYTLSCTLRSSFDTCVLKIQQYKRKTLGFRTFSCFGPHIWNSLLWDLRHCPTLSSFIVLKPNWKTSSSHTHSIFIATNISTQFLLRSLCVCMCVCVCVCVCVCSVCVCLFFHIILYVNCFGRTVLYMCIEYHV